MKARMAGVVICSTFAVTLPMLASACSLEAGFDYFQPTLKPFEWHMSKENPNSYERLPAPIVKVGAVKRATKPDNTSCTGLSSLNLTIEVPASSTYKAGDFGVYLRIVEGAQSRIIFPSTPVAVADAFHAQPTFHWYERKETMPQRMAMKVEAFFITNGMNIGPSTVFELQD